MSQLKVQHWRPSAPCTLSLIMFASAAGLHFAAEVHYASVCTISTSLDPLRMWTLCCQGLPLSLLQT